MELETNTSYVDLIRHMERMKKLNFMSLVNMGTHPHTIGLLGAIHDCKKKQDGAAVVVSDLVKYLRVPAPAVSKGLNFLEAGGCITRSFDPKDRRKILVDTTESGDQQLKMVYHVFDEFANTVFQKVGMDKMNAFMEIFGEMLEVAEDELNKRVAGGNVINKECCCSFEGEGK